MRRWLGMVAVFPLSPTEAPCYCQSHGPWGLDPIEADSINVLGWRPFMRNHSHDSPSLVFKNAVTLFTGFLAGIGTD